MTDTAGMTGISHVGTVFVPVSDQGRALEFYLNKLGFEKRSDFAYGGSHRWIEVAPPGSTNAIALVPPSEGTPVGRDQTYCAFATMDIEADHATLRARGVDVDAEIARRGTSRPGLFSPGVNVEDPMPPQFFLRDIDGNRFLLVEPNRPPGQYFELPWLLAPKGWSCLGQTQVRSRAAACNEPRFSPRRTLPDRCTPTTSCRFQDLRSRYQQSRGPRATRSKRRRGT